MDMKQIRNLLELLFSMLLEFLLGRISELVTART